MEKIFKITAIALLLVISSALPAQNVTSDIGEKYPFINLAADTLVYNKQSPKMKKFFQKLGTTVASKSGTLSIMHIGGSHVQAGTLSHRIRTNILTSFPGIVSDRGMIFPYSVGAKCNNPADYKIQKSNTLQLTRNVYKEPQKELGLCGIAVTAYDSTEWIKITLNEPRINFGTTQITLLGYSETGNVAPFILFQGREYPPTHINLKTRRYVFNFHTTVDSFTIVMPCKEEQSFTLTGVYLANRKSGITFNSIGVNGAATYDYHDKCPYFTKDLRLIKPDLVIFGIGINDAAGKTFDTVAFRRNYLRIIDSIKAVNPDCAFVFITNNDSYKKIGRRKYAANVHGVLARDVFYRLAKETDGAVWDLFEIMGGLGSMTKWRDAKLGQSDRIHFTPAGYNLLGDLFFNAFLNEISYPDDGQSDNFHF